MKRIASVLLALLCLLVSLPALWADAIWEPQDDFYQKHREDCAVVQKQYTANEAVDGVKSPESNNVVLSFQPGESMYVLFTYTDKDGALWGDCEQYSEEKEAWVSFWLPMEKLTKVYDSDDFLTEHQSELQRVTGLENPGLQPTGTVPLWNYPGAEAYDCWFDESCSEIDLEGYDGYTDETGSLWIYIPYFEGLSGWVYMPDPESTAPHAIALSAPSAAPAQSPVSTLSSSPTASPTAAPAASPAAEGSDQLPVRLLIVSVVLVVLLSALLIVLILRRSKRK